MSDVKDILGLPRQNDKGEQPKEKPKDVKQERPKGLSREAYNLLYGTHPIAPGSLLKEISKKDNGKPAPSSVHVTYQFLPFVNQARTDDLRLSHWIQCYEDAAGRVRPADDGDYPYARYNRSVGVYRYDDVEFETVIRPKFPESETGWSKAETDYLLDMCERLALNFIVIADRWHFAGGPARSVEDLKERYYCVAHELVLARCGSRELAANHSIVRTRYDAQRERVRKELLAMSLARTPQQAADEDAILEEAERILLARKQEAEARRSEGAPLLHPTTFSNCVSELPFFDRNVVPVAPTKPGVYLRRESVNDSLKKAIQEAPTQQQRVQKSLDSVIADVALVRAPPAMMTRSVSGAYLSLYSEALVLVNLRQRQVRMSLPVDEGRGKRAPKAKLPRYDEPALSGAAPKKQKLGK